MGARLAQRMEDFCLSLLRWQVGQFGSSWSCNIGLKSIAPDNNERCAELLCGRCPAAAGTAPWHGSILQAALNPAPGAHRAQVTTLHGYSLAEPFCTRFLQNFQYYRMRHKIRIQPSQFRYRLS